MTTQNQQSLDSFLDALASNSATPGGGGAAALMGAQAAALVSMVCNLTIGKPKYLEIEATMQEILCQSEQLRAEMFGMIAADVRVFNQVMAAYGAPKETEEEKIKRSALIQEALKAATLVPLSCAKASEQVIRLSLQAAELGNVNVISDAGVAAMAGLAAFKSAALNVYVNTGAIKDKEFAAARLAELAQIQASAEAKADQVYQLVKSKL